MKKYLTTLLAACCMLAAFSMPASALEYHFDGPDAGLFGRPTSDDTIYVTMDEPANTDRSKNAAYIPPDFGSPTSYTLNAGELLTPNLVSSSAAGTVSGTGGVTVLPPFASGNTGGGVTGSYTPVKYTAVERPLLQRRLPRYAENPNPRPVRQGVSGNGRGRAPQGRGPFCQHLHLGGQCGDCGP